MAINESKLNVFMQSFAHAIRAVMHAGSVVLGDQLGLCKALAEAPATRETQPEAGRYLEVGPYPGRRQFRRAAETPFNLVFVARP